MNSVRLKNCHVATCDTETSASVGSFGEMDQIRLIPPGDGENAAVFTPYGIRSFFAEFERDEQGLE